jgi:hypothetical protein
VIQHEKLVWKIAGEARSLGQLMGEDHQHGNSRARRKRVQRWTATRPSLKTPSAQRMAEHDPRFS